MKALDDSKLVDYLVEVDCSENPELETLSPKIEACKALQKLFAQSCCITAIPTQLCAAKDTLKLIDLSNNKITEVPVELGALGALEDINLSKNALTALPDEVLAGWSKIEFLNLSDNKLTRVGSLAGCPKLYEILLNVCVFCAPRVLSAGAPLPSNSQTGVYCLLVNVPQGNQLESLPALETPHPELEKYNAADNPVKEAPEGYMELCEALKTITF